MHKAALIAAIAAMTPVWSASAQDAAPRTIAVTGSAEISLAPDRARVGVGVRSEAPGAAEAVAANSEDMTRIIAALQEAGVAEKDIRTSGFDVGPIWRWSQNKAGQREQELSGYYAANRITAMVRDLDALGAALDAAVRAGANQIDGVRFEASDADKALDSARGEALADARRKAALYAGAGEMRLGSILSIREAGTPADPRPTPYAVRSMEAAAPMAPPMAAGEETHRVTVHVVWSLAPAD